MKAGNKIINGTAAIVLTLMLIACVANADIQVSVDTDKSTYRLTDEVTFSVTADLTECEQVKSIYLDIICENDDVTCSLPRQYGMYPGYGSCDVDVEATETNPDNCYTYGGSNRIEYEILWDIPSSFEPGDCTAIANLETVEETTSGSTEFTIISDGTTTTTTCPSSTTSTSCTTTTTKAKKKKSSHTSSGGFTFSNIKIIASCNDSIKNYGETDVDCGGNCDGCDDGRYCIKDSDCKSLFCFKSICTTPTCDDSIRNQDETDVDCGGETCDGCDDGRYCLKDSDCKSENCIDNVCQPKEEECIIPLTCSDGILNQDETDIDCGGFKCRQCGEGRSCKRETDCLSGYCYNETCMVPTCSDGIRNQDETDIDCGGPCGACRQGGLIGYVTAISGTLGELFLILLLLLLVIFLLLTRFKAKRNVASTDFFESLEGEDDMERFVEKKKPCIVAGTSRKLKDLKPYIDEGKIEIVWIKDWDYVNQLMSRGVEENNAESIALAKQLRGTIYIKNEEAKNIAEAEGIKTSDKA